MSENNSSPTINISDKALIVPAFGKSKELCLEMTSIREAEKRFIEAKTVNPSTYSDLEHTFNESYRDLKKHLSSIGYQILLADKALRQAKADVLMGSYAEYMAGKPKYQDTSDMRDAFLIKDPAYVAALDRDAQLKALASNFEGKIKVVENVCKYMRQKMYLLSKSGVDMNVYSTIGRK